jgi:RNA polymerase sigma-70 factor (ECF subfamily)
MDSRGHPGFAQTHWSLIHAAQRGDAEQARAALGRIYEIYSYPLYVYLRRQGCPPEEAQDLLQAFFLRMIEKDFLRAVDPQRGRFRTFLLTALKHFRPTKSRAHKRRSVAAVKWLCRWITPKPSAGIAPSRSMLLRPKCSMNDVGP